MPQTLMLSEEEMPTTIRVIYTAKPKGRPGWPYQEFDPEERVNYLRNQLLELLHRHNLEIEIVGEHLITHKEEAARLRENLGREDGLLIFSLAAPSPLHEVLKWDIPIISFLDLYGDFVRPVPRRGIGLSTSNFEELASALRVLDALRRLRETTILYFREVGGVDEGYIARAKAKLGITIRGMGYWELVQAYKATDERVAWELAREWVERAERVVEPSFDEIMKSARMYLGLRALMEREGAQAATIDCLRMVYGGLLPAYPCLAYSRLNDEGYVGTCEADLASAFTQLILGYIGGVPGFISDPVIDTATNTVIHCHCMAPTRMGGMDAEPEPYIIRSHAEDNKGASLQVKMRAGQVVTVAKLDGLRRMLISTGEIIGNVDEERGCRTKVMTKVKDARKLLEGYSGETHRVLFYGDWVQQIKWLARILDLEVIEET